MGYKQLIINPGSTSTKLALYEDKEKVVQENVEHDAAQMQQFDSIADQIPFRMGIIRDFMARNSIQEKDLSAVMGRGSDELGGVLMKGFLFAVSQLPELPRTMLFYNGGASLTCKGSGSLEDLKSLEAQGVEILTCGTCLNFYGLTDQLAVGGVTNMYSIVEKLAGAGKVVKP